MRDALRALRESGLLVVPSNEAPLEVQRRSEDPPRLEGAAPLEGDTVVARAIVGAPVEGIAAFLDGIQRSRVLAHAGLVPMVHGAVAAAVRVRVDRRLRTWDAPVLSQSLYAPLDALGEAERQELSARCELRDTGAARGSHPQEFTARALSAVQRTREGAEAALAEAWVAREQGTLLVDGGIRGMRATATHPLAVGVVKSHRTLYVPGESLGTVLGLREGERTTAVLLETPNRVAVATWYLRLRGGGERSPFFGLVRVEVAREGPGDIGARADLVSRWILAERAPVSLPDQRWDVMVYGIRECEQYLSSILR